MSIKPALVTSRLITFVVNTISLISEVNSPVAWGNFLSSIWMKRLLEISSCATIPSR